MGKHRSAFGTRLAADPYRSALARLLAAILASDDFVFFAEPASELRKTILDALAAELVQLRCRLVRVCSGGRASVGLPDLLSQIVAHSDPAGGTGDALERCHRLLTEASETCDQIVLLIDDAHALQPNALRYVQLTSRSSQRLRVAFAGEPRIVTEEADPEFRYFHTKPSTFISVSDQACDSSLHEQVSVGNAGAVEVSSS